jgi:peptidoglycan/LPS O-acetylase OafA/YrhL
MNHLKYRADIDALRAIAVLSVLFYHAFPQIFKSGFIGVDFFFVISGFLISTIILKDLEQGTFSFKTFYIRRIKRILPALLFVIISTSILAFFSFTLDQWIAFGKHAFFSMCFLSNEILYKEVGYFDVFAEYKIFLHFWSLAIEEQFYLIWPLLLYVIHRKYKQHLKHILWLCFFVSISIHFYLLIDHESAAFYRSPSRFWELILGAILAQMTLQNGAIQFSKYSIHFQSVMASILLILCLIFVRFEYAFPGICALLICMAMFLLIACGPNALCNQWLASQRWLVAIGLISYPLYLWHWVLFACAKMILLRELSIEITFGLIVLSFILAWVSNEWVEKKLRYAQSPWVSFALIVISIGIAVMGLMIWKIKYYPQRMDHEKPLLEMIYNENDFKSRYALKSCKHLGIDQALQKYCKAFQADDLNQIKGKAIVLWGDSHAGAWSPAFFEYALKKKLPVIVISHGGFPPILGAQQSGEQIKNKLFNHIGWNEIIYDFIQKIDPSDLVLIARWSLYVKPWILHGVVQKKSYLTTQVNESPSYASSLLALQKQLPITLHKLSKNLQNQPRNLVIFKSVPMLKSFIALGMSKQLDFIPTKAEHLKEQKEINQIIDQISQKSQIHIYDPTLDFCPDLQNSDLQNSDLQNSNGKCLVQKNKIYLYTDDNHISAQGAILFLDRIIPLLSSANGQQF